MNAPLVHRRQRTPQGVRGFSLIEAMVALLVLSIGLLGIAALYVETLRASRTALYRTEAVVQATEEAVINVLVTNEEMIGFRGHRTPGLPRERVASILRERGVIA